MHIYIYASAYVSICHTSAYLSIRNTSGVACMYAYIYIYIYIYIHICTDTDVLEHRFRSLVYTYADLC